MASNESQYQIVTTSSSGSEETKKSGWGAFEDAGRTIEEYQKLFDQAYMNLNAADPSARRLILNSAFIIYRRLWPVSTTEQRNRFNELRQRLVAMDKDIKIAIESELHETRLSRSFNSGNALTDSMDSFRSTCETFALHSTDVQQKAGLLYAKPRDTTDSLMKSIKAQQVKRCMYFEYAGIHITPQMWYLARLIALRSDANWDSLILVSAPRGSGKSVFALTLATVLSEMNTVPFNLEKQCMFQQKKEDVLEIYKTLPKKSTFILDQAGAQLMARQAMHGSQISLLTQMDFSRNLGRCVIVNWHSSDELDGQVRTMSTAAIQIPMRSLCVFKSPNLNPKAKRGTTSATAAEKKEVITNDTQAHEASVKEETTQFVIPYRDLASRKNTEAANALWDAYAKLKNPAGEGNN